MAVRDINVAQLFFVSFVFLTDVRKNVTPAEVELLHELLDNPSWCAGEFVRTGIAVLREQYSSLWESYENGRIAVDVDALSRELDAVATTATTAEVLALKRDLSTFVDKLTHANTTSLSRFGLTGSNNARAQSRSTISYLLTLIEEQYAERSERRAAAASPSAPVAPVQTTRAPRSTPDAATPPAAIASGASSALTPWDGRTIPVRCIAVIAETNDARTYLFASDRVGLFNYKAGQFLSLEVNVGDRLLRRCYTISSSPSRPRALSITVKRLELGRMSNWLFENMSVGGRAEVAGPFGEFHIERTANRKLLMLAAGSGITPIISMLRWMADVGDARDVIVINNVRSPTDLIYGPELGALSAQLPSARIVVAPSSTAGAAWVGLSGRLCDSMLHAVAPDAAERDVFLCGPSAYMRAANEILIRAGLPASRIYQEGFGAANAGTSEPPSQDAQSTAQSSRTGSLTAVGGALREAHPVAEAMSASTIAIADDHDDAQTSAMPSARVVFEQSEVEIACNAGALLLDVAEANDIALTSGCRSGLCGACRVRKVAGEVKMPPDTSLTADDIKDGYVLSCVGRVYGRVVVDR